jgi:peroxiredoxin family protein
MSEALEPKDRMTLIVFSGEMDKALAAFTLANTAASMGKKVTVFFTFWGINVIRKPSPTSGKGWMRWMLGRMNRGGSDNLPLSRLNMLGLGPWMMKKLMKESRMASVEESLRLAKEMGVHLVACTQSMGVMGVSKDDLIPEIEDFEGAASYLGEASKSDANLFIS